MDTDTTTRRASEALMVMQPARNGTVACSTHAGGSNKLTTDRRVYLNAYQVKWMRARREEWIQQHGPCAKCGSRHSLEVDHIDPALKVSHRIWSWKKERRDEELKKCQVLCSSCHKEKTANQIGRPIQHGTRTGYSRGCRCVECRRKQSDRMSRYHADHPRTLKSSSLR